MKWKEKLCTSFYHSFLWILVHKDLNLNHIIQDQVVYILLSFVSCLSITLQKFYFLKYRSSH